MAAIAAHEGFKVAIFEKDDFAGKASSNNLRLIHGGIRYLQSLNIKRTIDSIRQRAVFNRQFGYGCRDIECVMRTGRGVIDNPATVWAGFALYNTLVQCFDWRLASLYGRSGVRKLSAREVGGQALMYAHWRDMQVLYPERPVIEYLKYAESLGATVKNHTHVLAISSNENQVALDIVGIGRDSGDSRCITADLVLDCTGGECDADFCDPRGSKNSAYSLAVNVVLDIAPQERAIAKRYSTQQGSRLLFITPGQTHTLAGTWYFDGANGSQRKLTRAESEVVMSDLDAMLGRPIEQHEIIGLQQGLLPLRAGHTNSDDYATVLAASSRFFSKSAYTNVYRIEGSKYTSAFMDAYSMFSDIVSCSSLQGFLTSGQCKRQVSKPLALSCQINDERKFVADLQQTYSDVEPEVLQRLIVLYGKNAEHICRRSVIEKNRCVGDLAHTMIAEIDYVVENEWVVTLDDLLSRRMGFGFGWYTLPEELIGRIACHLADKLGWTDRETEVQLERYLLHRVTKQWLTI